MLRCKKNIPFIILAFISILVVALYGVAYMDAALRKQQLASYNFLYIANAVYKNKLALKIYGYLFIIIVMAFLYLFIADTKSYKSDQVKITDTISTPVPAGQGQCGTARWLSKKEYDKAFSNYEFDMDILKEWDKIKLDDIKEELRRMK